MAKKCQNFIHARSISRRTGGRGQTAMERGKTGSGRAPGGNQGKLFKPPPADQDIATRSLAFQRVRRPGRRGLPAAKLADANDSAVCGAAFRCGKPGGALAEMAVSFPATGTWRVRKPAGASGRMVVCAGLRVHVALITAPSRTQSDVGEREANAAVDGRKSRMLPMTCSWKRVERVEGWANDDG